MRGQTGVTVPDRSWDSSWRRSRRFWCVVPAVVAVFLLLGACASLPGPAGDADNLAARAQLLARENIIVDTHIDVAYRLEKEWVDVSERTEGGDFDAVRAKAGGLDAPFMSIYTPASLQKTGGSKELADKLIDMVESLVEESPGIFALARSPADVRANFEAGLISLPMGMENGAPIGEDLENLRHFHQRGIRYVTLTHGKWNAISDSSYDDDRHWGGLSPFGLEVVAEMNRLGIMIDISHLTDEAALQTMAASKAPVIASHSSCRKFTPGWERNMSDELIEALAANGGVIQINFGSPFLTAESQEASEAMWTAADAYREEHDLDEDDPAIDEFRKAYREKNPPVLADVSDVADHIDHVVALVGIDHVGIGSDFDGVGPTTPTGLKDVSQYPNLIRVLLERGYSDEEVIQILGENTLRVWSEIEQVAAEIAAES